MTDIRFYHLEHENWDQALPKLLERVISANLKAVVKVQDIEQAQKIDGLLWTYKADSFLPHDQEGCDMPSRQPIFITTQQENPSDAECLILLDADQWDDFTGFKRILYMFNGLDNAVVQSARDDWKRFKSLNFDMSYWQQSQGGSWAQKA